MTKAKKEFNLTPTANSRTIKMGETRTFFNEDEAVEQLMAWEGELEAKGWSIKKQSGSTITMTKLNARNIPQTAKLWIA